MRLEVEDMRKGVGSIGRGSVGMQVGGGESIRQECECEMEGCCLCLLLHSCCT